MRIPLGPVWGYRPKYASTVGASVPFTVSTHAVPGGGGGGDRTVITTRRYVSAGFAVLCQMVVITGVLSMGVLGVMTLVGFAGGGDDSTGVWMLVIIGLLTLPMLPGLFSLSHYSMPAYEIWNQAQQGGESDVRYRARCGRRRAFGSLAAGKTAVRIHPATSGDKTIGFFVAVSGEERKEKKVGRNGWSFEWGDGIVMLPVWFTADRTAADACAERVSQVLGLAIASKEGDSISTSVIDKPLTYEDGVHRSPMV